MAMGSTAHETVGHVKSTIDDLECSPSHCGATSNFGPHSHGAGQRAVGHGVGSHQTTSKLKHGTTRPKPRGTHVEGKKNLMAKKTHGR